MCLKPQNYKRTAHLQYLAKMTVKHCMEVMEMSFEKKDEMQELSYLNLTEFLKYNYEDSSDLLKKMSNIEEHTSRCGNEWVDRTIAMHEQVLDRLHIVWNALSDVEAYNALYTPRVIQHMPEWNATIHMWREPNDH